MGCDNDSHDFTFWPDSDSDYALCACGAQAALFDHDTGDLIGIRDVI